MHHQIHRTCLHRIRHDHSEPKASALRPSHRPMTPRLHFKLASKTSPPVRQYQSKTYRCPAGTPPGPSSQLCLLELGINALAYCRGSSGKDLTAIRPIMVRRTHDCGSVSHALASVHQPTSVYCFGCSCGIDSDWYVKLRGCCYCYWCMKLV